MLDYNIEIRLIYRKELPAEFVTTAIQCINDAYYASELQDLKSFREEFAEASIKIPAVAFDAAEHRMKEYRKSAVFIRAGEKGSLVLEVSFAFLALWLVKMTLGETIKEAWKESDLHEQIKQFLLKRLPSKEQKIKEEAIKKLRQRLPCEVFKRDILLTDVDRYGPYVITGIDVHLKPLKNYPPLLGTVFENSHPKRPPKKIDS